MQAFEGSKPMSVAVSPQKQNFGEGPQLRILLHELGNELEVVLYASDLLARTPCDPTGPEWAIRLAAAARKAVAIHHEMQTLVG